MAVARGRQHNSRGLGAAQAAGLAGSRGRGRGCSASRDSRRRPPGRDRAGMTGHHHHQREADGARSPAGRIPDLATEVAAELGVDLVPTNSLRLRQRRDLRRFGESVRGCDAFVIQSHGAPINQWIMEQLIMVDALKRASAKRITVIAALLRLRPAGQEAPRPRADLGPADGRPVQDRRRRPADHASTCTPRRSRASSTGRSTTCGRCRCCRSTCAPGSTAPG